ncbi:MAG: hypothetical protein Q4A84_08740 [Neisseria sp.]|nr:hypothetical protein [Neisseria sp.]
MFRDIADSIYHDIPAPKFLGYENGVDVTRFYKGQIPSDMNINLLIQQLNDNNYSTRFLREDKKMTAAYLFYTKGFIRRVETQIYIEVDIDNISNFKATYFSSLDI